MPALYVENVPDNLYEALRERARKHRKSMASEIISLLEENIPTAAELKLRRQRFQKALRMSQAEPLSPGPFASAEETIRKDRKR